MSRKPTSAEIQVVTRLIASRLSLRLKLVLLAVFAVGLLVYYALKNWPAAAPAAPPPAAAANPDGSADLLFCFWNVENLFDDKDDKRREVDEEFDNPFAADAELRQKKYGRLAEALLKMNGGRGPDVIACVEVESVRAADLLKEALNANLAAANADPKLTYTQVAMKNLDAGRHIAPCLITRLAVAHAQTRLHGRMLRVLETHVQVNGHDLCVIATHWTSQLKQKDGGGGESGREKYADLIYDVFAAKAAKDPNVDVLVCGDFNDTPDSPVLANHLGTTGDRTRVTPRAEKPQLLDLFAGKDARQFGTHVYNGRPLIYDHICVSPGLLDGRGWSCDPDSVRTVREGLTRPGATRPEPWRFGSPRNPPTGGRGYSDHFPVTVKLTVAAPGGAPGPE